MQPDRTVADDLCSFIDSGPSPYHAVEAAAGLLDVAGYTQVAEIDVWGGAPGGRYLTRGGTLIAWHQPAVTPTRFRIVGAHTDSPNLRIKPNPDVVSAGVRQLGVEVYGGALLNSWLDRDLGICGRASVATADGPIARTFRVDDPLLRVAQLAIHLDRGIKENGLQLNSQQHMAPMWDLAEPGEGAVPDESSFVAWLAGELGVEPEAVLAWDAMAFDLTPSRRTGRNGVFVSAPRLDNLCSSFAALRGLLQIDESAVGSSVPVVCLYDHEEVGSTSSSGADSVILVNALERIMTAAGGDRDGLLRALAASVCVSADMAHATHPNYVDKHEPSHNIALNAGPVIKVNVNQRYASDSTSVGIFVDACASAGVPTQRYVNRTDLPCGSTIGPITSARLGVSTVDVGVAQLAMHSTRELCGADDPSYYEAAMAAFLAR